MIRVVIDTNVVVSANLRDEGLPAGFLDLFLWRQSPKKTALVSCFEEDPSRGFAIIESQGRHALHIQEERLCSIGIRTT